jgi:hypothetical protein
MKLTATLTLALATLGSAWQLDLWTNNGRHTTMHGKLPACNNISFEPALKVRQAKYNPATPILADPRTFELYARPNCQGLSYRNKRGNWKMTPRVVRSYRIVR